MGKLSLWAGMLILIFVSTISPTSLNGRFVVLNSDSSKLTVLLQINTNTGTDDLGGATIVIGFNKQVLSFSSNPLKQIDYNFHNFNAGSYSEATVTRPLSDKIWINIDLPSINNDQGTVVKGADNWTDVVTLNFSVLSNSDSIGLSYLSENGFWGVYDADNKISWTKGELNNLLLLPDNELTTVEADNNVPAEFELSQNYPNPFNPSTKISFSLPVQTQLRLTVYNLVGEVVTTLIDEEMAPGNHQVEFNAEGLTSGIYFYRIETPAFVETKKMILLK